MLKFHLVDIFHKNLDLFSIFIFNALIAIALLIVMFSVNINPMIINLHLEHKSDFSRENFEALFMFF